MACMSTNPTMPLLETADVETSSDGYAKRFEGPVGQWFLQIQERIALSMLRDVPPGATILDVGGGHGQLAVPLCREGFKVTVLGSDESCGRRIAPLAKEGKCRFKTGDVIDLPFPDKSFDVAISFRLLPHCEQWPKLVAELCRVAARAVIVDYPAIRGLNAMAPALFSAKKKIEGNTRQWRQFTDREVQTEFQKNGFEVGRREGQFFLPMAMHRAMKLKPVSAGLEACFRVIGLTHCFGSPVIACMKPRNG